MKIWGEITFGPGMPVLRNVVTMLCGVPDPLRATRHSGGEDEAKRPIKNVEEFAASLDRFGTMLWAKHAHYTVRAPRDARVECMCQFKVDPPLVRAFMERMAPLDPIFGFACAWEENCHRNQIIARLRVGTLEAFVGSDLSKRVPGLYWLTLLSERLAARHGVPLAGLEAAALEHVALGGGLRLFRFHDHPAKWRERADEVDALCTALPGVFDIADLRARLVGVTEQRELYAIIDPWR